MALLTSQKVTKAYVVEPVLEDVSFHVERGDHIGVVGLNGSGKSTLFKLITGELSPDEGRMIHPKDWKVGYLSQLLSREEWDMTLYEFCLAAFQEVIQMEHDLHQMGEDMAKLSHDPEALEAKMEAYGQLQEEFERANGYGYLSEIRGTLIGLGFQEEEFSRNIQELSGGQKARLSLARLLLQKPDLLLLDEPTNHLDIKAINWLEKFLRDYPGTLMVISHDRYFLDGTVTRIFHVEQRRLKSYESNYTGFMQERKRNFAILQKQYENQQKEVARQEEIIRRFKNYGDSRYIKQAQSRQKLLDKMALAPPPNQDAKARFRFTPGVTSGQDVLMVENLSKQFGDVTVFENLSFQLRRGDHVGLIGDNGSGKTTILRILLGQLAQSSGEVEFGAKVQTGYYDQEMRDLSFDKTVIDEFWDAYPKLDYYTVRSLLARFLFIGDDIFKEVGELSGGEKGRLSLLKLMLSNANLLLMDEPTNHLDVDSKEVLEEALIDYEGTLLIISHDRYFLNRVCDKTLALEDGNLSLYLGNYDYYLEKKAELLAEEEEEEVEDMTRTRKKQLQREERKNQEATRKARRQVKALEDEIHKLEAALSSLDARLADPSIYDDYEKAAEVSKKREDTQKSLDETWEAYFEFMDT